MVPYLHDFGFELLQAVVTSCARRGFQRLNGAGSNTERSEVNPDSTPEGEVDHQHHSERHCSEERPGIHEVGPFHRQGRHAYRGRQQ